MENKGLKIEESQIEKPKKLQILAIISVVAAIKVMPPLESRDEKNTRIATDLLSENEIILLLLISKK
jgi:hypothetical protein